ncbi:MAG TPA: response regulator [Terriglobia bacterium]|nr:response regulator [Terriglobia bacterium]
MSTAPANPTATRTILIVEDHALVAKFYRMALERAGGYTCLVTEDVPEILAAVEAGRIDLAILDISLRASELDGRPVDGLELARLIRQRTPRPLPIILATAHAMVGDRERLLAASGADAYLEKPVYDAEQLVGLVRRLLDAPR